MSAVDGKATMATGSGNSRSSGRSRAKSSRSKSSRNGSSANRGSGSRKRKREEFPDYEIVDPHTAVGLAAAATCRGDHSVPIVTLSTAHPAKFPDAVEAATGRRPALPPFLADLHDRPERYEVLPNDLDALRAHIRQKVLAA